MVVAIAIVTFVIVVVSRLLLVTITGKTTMVIICAWCTTINTYSQWFDVCQILARLSAHSVSTNSHSSLHSKRIESQFHSAEWFRKICSNSRCAVLAHVHSFVRTHSRLMGKKSSICRSTSSSMPCRMLG